MPTRGDRPSTFSFARLAENDLDWFLSIRNQVAHNLHDQRTFTLQEAIRWLPVSSTEYWTCTADFPDGHTRIGYFRLRPFGYPWLAEIGMDLDPQYHGRGLAAQAYRAFARDVLHGRGVRLLTLRVRSENTRAIRLYTSLGFQPVFDGMFEGTSEQGMYIDALSLAGETPKNAGAARFPPV